MKITIHNTSKIVNLGNVPARVWEGETESGIKVNCFITRIIPILQRDDPKQEEFQAQLQEVEPPSVTADAWPARLVL